MATCDPAELVAAGKCFSLSCISRDNQVVAELELLRRWAGFTGTVQELLTAGRCFSASCLSADAQVVAELQLYCDIANAAPPVVCFTLDMSSTPALVGNDGTATATPVGGVGPFTYLWSDAQTTQTATGLSAGDYTCTVTDTGAPTCIVDGNATVAATTLIYSGGTVDPQINLWTVVGNIYQSGNDVYASLDTALINVSAVDFDGHFTLSGLGTVLNNFGVINSSATGFDFTGCSDLIDIDLDASSALIGVDLSECSGLVNLFISNCQALISLSTAGLANLVTLNCNHNAVMTFLSIENCPALVGVAANTNALDTLMVFNNTSLGSLAGYNIDFSENNLDASNINAFLVYFDSLASSPPSPPTSIYLQNGTNAPPSGAGITAANNIIGRSWDLNTN